MGARLRDIAEGRRDALNIDPNLIVIEEGFNPRQYTLFENREHLDSLKASIKEMGVRVPLLVRWDVGTEQAILIDGECRLRACLELIGEGVEIKTVPVLQEAATNEADRLLLAITTNTGKPLTQIEAGKAFQRLIGYGWSPEDIGRRTGHSVRFVKASIELSDAPEEVKTMVAEGSVTPALAVKAVREKGSGATETLREKVTAAKAAGKKKASRERGEGKEAKAKTEKTEKTDRLLILGDQMAEAILMDESQDWEAMEKLAEKWQKARA